MSTMPRALGIVLYGILFAVIVPLLLVAWAAGAASNVTLPPIQSILLAGLFGVTGVLLMLSGMVSLYVYGRGMPMNAYPPPDYVTRGPFRLLRHPIYVGFSLLCVAASLAAGSASGLWLVSPALALGCTALVLGYENIDLRVRFGAAVRRPVLALPRDGEVSPSNKERIAVYVFVLLPWLVLYEALAALGLDRNALSAFLPFENTLPVLEWTEYLYAGTYVLVCLAPVVAPSQRLLREFALQGLWGTFLMVLLFTTIPLIAPPRPFVPSSLAGEMLVLDRSLDTPANAFPSLHVFWILSAMAVFAARMPRVRSAWWALGAAIALSCITTGMHAIADVVGGALLYVAVRNRKRIWEFIRGHAERIANSWMEWQWGPVRLINHGLYAGIGSALAVAIVGTLLGPSNALSIITVALSALVVSALWAQVVEGSPSLLRPYGYYGGVVGIIAGSLLAGLFLGTGTWLLLAAYSVAGPWVQSFGRLRCLVQGCCHGREAPVGIGIVYTHPRSRVCRLAHLQGIPIHPTPVYSILWNVVIAAILTRLWFAHVPLSMIAGLYLILTGLGRFVEEAYRGEPQTRTLRGLRLYQWIAILTVVVGAVFTCLHSEAASARPDASPLVLAMALSFGAITWFALGVDFPGSNRRFARLV